MRTFEIEKSKEGHLNSLIIYEADKRFEADLEVVVCDPECDHIADILLTKEEVVELRDFLNKHLQEKHT